MSLILALILDQSHRQPFAPTDTFSEDLEMILYFNVTATLADAIYQAAQ